MRPPRRPVTAVHYAPPPGHALDVELYRVAELRRRVGDADARGLERIDFPCLIHLTAGSCRHMVDFEILHMAPGSLLVLQPGQVHRFGDLSGCDGWLLAFRSEWLPAALPEAMQALADLPTHLRLSAAAQRAVAEAFERMADDARGASSRALSALLRAQVQALLTRLQLEGLPSHAETHPDPADVQRYRRYRAAVERDFARWHGLAPYAKRLGCSERSLTRAALAVTDRSAKAVLVERIVLEAKRLLAHTPLPVAGVGEQLGFAEATNFVKFFRRETGMTPGAFRARQVA